MKISDFTNGRDNNFKLIRLIAAFSVLITHSFAIAIGDAEAQPFHQRLGMTIGGIAVDFFFITSGFLVTASLLTRQNAIDYIWARVLRIFPALTVMLLMTVFVLGVYFTALPITTYLTDSRTYDYLLKGLTLIAGVGYDLPGVFNGNPFKNAINGSLWTMTHEVKMYAILVLVWVTLRISKSNRLRFFEFAIAALAVISGIEYLAICYFRPDPHTSTRLFFMFFCGGAFYVLKKHITLSHLLFWLFLIAMVISASINKNVFFVVYTTTVAYVLLYLVFIPAGFVRKYNQVGDYSYGVYLYAFPVQQSVAALIPGISTLSLGIVSAIATLLLGMLSWHLLEERALRLKGFYVGHTERILKHRKK